jgi:hypothetical protein
MERSDFYEGLSAISDQYNWDVDGNSIVGRGRNRNQTWNPVTALARSLRVYNASGNSKRETLKAGTAMGLPREFTEQVYNATIGSSNRGNAQVVRGRIRSALGV